MGLKIDHECDWCGTREAVSLPKKGPLNLESIGLPEGWDDMPSFPGGEVGPQDGQQLCDACKTEHASVLTQAEKARDEVFRNAMARARSRAGKQVMQARPAMTSSFPR